MKTSTGCYDLNKEIKNKPCQIIFLSINITNLKIFHHINYIRVYSCEIINLNKVMNRTKYIVILNKMLFLSPSLNKSRLKGLVCVCKVYCINSIKPSH